VEIVAVGSLEVTMTREVVVVGWVGDAVAVDWVGEVVVVG
jgi:hypothetical protein